MRPMSTSYLTPLVLERGLPPATSYWVGVDRAALNAAISARRSQQGLPSTKFGGIWDPLPDSERGLKTRLSGAAQAHRRLRWS